MSKQPTEKTRRCWEPAWRRRARWPAGCSQGHLFLLGSPPGQLGVQELVDSGSCTKCLGISGGGARASRGLVWISESQEAKARGSSQPGHQVSL